MSSQSSNKSSSRWGSFLQQAVAGVESRLDTILADEDTKLSTSPPSVSKQTLDAATKKDTYTAQPRSASHDQRNDRLRERLAKAVVTRSTTRPAAQSPKDCTLSSRPASPGTILPTNEDDIEVLRSVSNDEPTTTHKHNVQSLGVSNEESLSIAFKQEPSTSSTVQNDHILSSAPRGLSEGNVDSRQTTNESSSLSGHKHLDTISLQSSSLPLMASADSSPLVVEAIAVVDPQNSSNEAANSQWREETNLYLEHIDALQAKLRYLAKEAVEVSRKAASEATAESVEQKLALKDEKIALLIEEGQTLSQNELKHTTTVRQLRARLAEEVKAHNQAREAISKMSKIAEAAQNRATQAEFAAREQAEKMNGLLETQNEIVSLQAKTRDQESRIINLRQQLLVTNDPEHQQHSRRLEDALDAEKTITSDLRDDLSNMKLEKELLDERQRARLRELQEKLDHEQHYTKRVESELRAEIGVSQPSAKRYNALTVYQVLENRLESYRTRAEEASSTETKDNQVKLLRQTEVLQSQYVVATQNWRGIESSLLARIANLEKERDEIMRKENESRRKNREIVDFAYNLFKFDTNRLQTIKLRRMDEDLQHAARSIVELQETIQSQKDKLTEAEKAFGRTQKDLENTSLELKDQNAKASRLTEQLGGTKASYHEVSPMNPEILHQRANVDSSIHSLTSKPSLEKLNYHSRPRPMKPIPGLSGDSTAQPDRPLGRRQSTQPSQVSSVASPSRQDSIPHLTYQILNGHTPETPSIRAEQFEDFFDGTSTPLTPDRTINDVISVSTTAAGPSVQLIERMSATVRRLETEKASSRDELERVTAQRDETREQVTSLMQEIEESKDVSEKVKVLEGEVAAINQRYQTTLEMLGEKSELVEELRADVADVKQMYKDLIESTLR